MLIETPPETNDVVSIKLVGGDEIVGRLVQNVTADQIKVKHPLIVMMAQSGFGMMPFMLTVSHDATHTIDRTHVISYKKTHEEIAKQYLKQTTGIQLP